MSVSRAVTISRVGSRKVSMGFLRERDFSRDQPCETETSRETRVSHGLASKVSAIPHLRQIFRHVTALFYCLRQYSVLKIGLEFLARPGLRDETKVSRSRLASRLARSRSETQL